MKILVIDDEASITKFIEANLCASGYQVVCAADGKDGLAMAESQGPDLILLDLRMPDMSGWDVLMVLKNKRELEKTPVIIMTASVPEVTECKIRGMGADGYLLKPFGTDELLDQIRLATGA